MYKVMGLLSDVHSCGYHFDIGQLSPKTVFNLG